MYSTLLTLAAFAAPVLAAPSSDCLPLGESTAPKPYPNTPEAFASWRYYDTFANSTDAPANYERFMTAGHAALHDESAYITYKELASYNVSACANECDGAKGCASFNIYFQRHPSLTPGPACPNPEANVIVRCALFKTPMSVAQATNHGQQRGPVDEEGDKFEVMIRGSNAFNRFVSPSQRVTVTATATATETEVKTETETETATETETETVTETETETLTVSATKTVTNTVTQTVL